MKPFNRVFTGLQTTIFETMSRLAVERGAINLGQGFPEGLEPQPLLDQLVYAVQHGPQQYPPMMGTPQLRQAIARHEADFWSIPCDPLKNVMVTSGATEALAACLIALLSPGDEVIVMEPCYDSYAPIIRAAGGVVRAVRLDPPKWDLPRIALADAFNERTKAVIINSPTNPTGKVFDRDELSFIAALVIQHDVIALCDEVYEHLVYDEYRHLPLMTLPGMAERCIKVGSAGKIFSLTGWKVGWVVAPPELLAVIAKVHQYLTFTTPPALQAAVAWGLDQYRDGYQGFAKTLVKRRDHLAAGLRKVGFDVLPASGSYFLSTQYAAFSATLDDEAFCRRLVSEAGVAAIPVSAFYQDNHPTGCIRFCFAKTDLMLDEAILRLERWSRHLG